MHSGIVIILIIVLIYLFYFKYYKYSYYNTVSVSACSTCEKYNVHQSHNGQKDAAAILAEINRRNNVLIEHLKTKYLTNHFSPGMDSTKNNHIDVIPESELSPWTAESMFDIDKINDMKKLMEGEYIQERVEQLITRYNPKQIYEISPLNNSGVTSYTQDKHILILCLRKKEKNANGENELHDINTIMFVVIHELSHMMNNLWGHKMDFWILFKFMLMNSVECGIYTTVDYSKNPIVYCGLKIDYQPLNDGIV